MPDERLYITCHYCALWRPVREDSVGGIDQMGVCPRRHYPCNLTSGRDRCRNGVMSVDTHWAEQYTPPGSQTV